ncbi:hypothetical protein [Priestia koreensis]|uniref:hypothetical protein n=1 Tax=Priestia koreensis TaxID=284581 RepID=UPI00345A476B
MKGLFEKANDKITNFLQKENNLLSKAKEKVERAGVPIPITADLLSKMIAKQLDPNEIRDFQLTFEDENLVIKGTAKKMLLKIPFQLTLQPVKTEKRTIYFALKEMKPLNQDWIRSKALNKPPLLSYEEGHVKLDLNQLDKIKYVPVGNIQHMEIKNEKLWVKIGL